jgi:serine/threonine protein kinase
MSLTQIPSSLQAGKAGQAYVLPVVLPPHKLHSASSTSTICSESSQGSCPSSSEKVDIDKEMLRYVLSTYEYRGVLGKGSSAQVVEVAHKGSGEVFACKIVRKNRSFNDDRTMSTETEIMKRMDHPNILRLHELYETPSARWFVLEHANAGSLQQAISFEQCYSEKVVAGAFKQVLEGVGYLHSIGIVHRDLKQDNILCKVTIGEDGSRQYTVKVADFGLSAVLDVATAERFKQFPATLKSYAKLKQMWGTTEYFAPEVYNKAYGPQADVWALGCVLYELLTGDAPFPVREMPTSVVEKYLLHGGRKLMRHFEMRPAWHALSAEARDLVSRMLKVNPRKRLSVAECLDHPFITEQPLPVDNQTARNALPVLGTTQAAVGAIGGERAKESKVLLQARDTANRVVLQNARKLKVLEAQLERERVTQ